MELPINTPSSANHPPFLGRYEIKKELGRGGMGAVYLVYDPVLKREVALKTILNSKEVNSVKRFMHEAKTMAKLNHPNIVKIYDIGMDGETPYFTMEFITGKNLADLEKEGKIATRRVVEIVRKVSFAIDYAHKEGILHRDLKPANIIMTQQGEPIVMDFGLAKEISGDSRLSKSGAILGTPAYMPPEQAWGKRKEVDERSDVYGLGAVFYELLTGMPPFHGSNHAVLLQVVDKEPVAPRAISPIIPQDIENICLKAMSKEKAMRYQTALELARDLERFLNGDPVMAVAPSQLYKMGKWLGKNRAVVVVATICLLALVSLAIYSHLEIRRKNKNLDAARIEALTNYTMLQLEMADKKWCEGNQRIAILSYTKLLADAKENRMPEEMIRLVRLRLAYYFSGLMYCRDILQEHTGEISAIAVSPDGKTFATGSHDKTIRVYDVATLRHKIIFQGLPAAIHTVAFNSTGTMLASGSEDGAIRLWNCSTGQTEYILQGHKGPVYSVKFSPTEPTLASGSGDGNVCLWNLNTRMPLASFRHNAWVKSVDFSPDGKTLVSGSYDKIVRLWDTHPEENQKNLEVLLLGHTELVSSVMFSPDGKTVASGSYDRTVRLWDVSTKSAITILYGHFDRLHAVAFSPDGSTLASAGLDRTICLWDMETKHKKCILSGRLRIINALAFSKNSQTLLSGNNAGTVWAWNVAPTTSRNSLKGHTGPVLSVSFSPDGAKLVSGARDCSARLWDLATGTSNVYAPRQISWVFSAAFHPNGKTLALGTHDKNFPNPKCFVIVLDTELRQKDWLEGTWKPKNCLAFSPDGKWLATALDEQQLILYDVEKRVRVPIEGAKGEIYELAFSPDGKFLASGNQEKMVLLWDISKKRITNRLPGHTQEVLTVAFSPDGKILASGSIDSTIGLWDVASASHKNWLKGHTDMITSVKFSPDGKVLASGSSDCTVRLWDVQTGHSQAIFETGSAAVHSVTFSPDGKILAAGCSDNLVRLWKMLAAPEFLKLSTEEIQARIQKHLGLDRAETAK